jgi:hypothetical protein
MAKSKKQLHEALRVNFITALSAWLAGNGEEVLRTNSNEVAIPVVDEEGNEEFILVTVKVPTGSRDGDVYDGYSMAEDYQMKLRQQAEKAAKAEAEKAKKIAKDTKMREQKAKAKAEREAANKEGE